MAATASNVVAMSGSCDLLRRRAVARAVKAQEKKGFRIDYIDGSLQGEMRKALAADSLFFAAQVLVVVQNPDKADLSLIEAHHKKGEQAIILLLHLEEDPDKRTKFGKFVEGLGRAT